MNRVRLLILIGIVLIFVASCNKKDYPCPGLGQNNEADFSLFDENGQLKDPKKSKNKGRIDKTTGMVNKKKPKKLNAPRKKHI
ncbi:MAG: hypothetical protein ACK40G_06780 [Cytophagaceae bacterium]